MNSKDVTFWITVNGKPVHEYAHEGDTYIEGRKGSTFQIHVHNKSMDRVLVVPAVDGLSTLDGKSAGPTSPGLIVGPFATTIIPGWMIDPNNAAEFLFADKDSSYSRSVDSTSTNAGVIGLLVFDEIKTAPEVKYVQHIINAPIPPWGYPWAQRPYNPWGYLGSASDITFGGGVGISQTYGVNAVDIGEAATASTSTNSTSTDSTQRRITTKSAETPFELGVGWGKSVDFKLNSTTFNKGSLKTQFVVYYDSRKNLERRGIRLELRDTTSSKPNPFPGLGCTPPAGWKS